MDTREEVNGVQEREQTESPGPRLASESDPVRIFLSLFKEHLDNASSLGPTTIEFTVRSMGDIMR